MSPPFTRGNSKVYSISRVNNNAPNRRLIRRQPYAVIPRSNHNERMIDVSSPQQHSATRQPIDIQGVSSRTQQLMQHPIGMVSASAPTRTNMDQFIAIREAANGEQDTRTRKKQQHNLIERRRRVEINNSISKLGRLLPDSYENKRYKGATLKASCEYIKFLQEQQKLWTEVDKQNRHLLNRVQQLEQILRENHVQYPQATFSSEPLVIQNNGCSSLDGVSDRPIKQETSDEYSSPPNVHSANVASQLSEMAITSPATFSSTGVCEQENFENDDAFFQNGWVMNDNITELNDFYNVDTTMQDDPILGSDILWDQSNFSPDSNQQPNSTFDASMQ